MSAGLWHWLRLPGRPPVPRALWLTLAGWGLCISNYLLLKEIWTHAPLADPVFETGQWLLGLALAARLAGPLVFALAGYGGVSGAGQPGGAADAVWRGAGCFLLNEKLLVTCYRWRRHLLAKQ